MARVGVLLSEQDRAAQHAGQWAPPLPMAPPVTRELQTNVERAATSISMKGAMRLLLLFFIFFCGCNIMPQESYLRSFPPEARA